MRALKIVILGMIPLFLLSGCWGKLELEQRDFVVVMGLDKAEGQDNFIEVTFQVANPQVGSTERGSAQNEPPSDIITITASDIVSAKELANTIVPRKLTFAQLRTVIISEELAKTDLSHHIISSAAVDPEMRRENNIIVSKEKASEFIHANKPKLETRPHKYYFFMQQRWRDTGLVAFSNFNRYYQRLSGDIFLAIYATAEKEEVEKRNEDGVIAGQIQQKTGDPVQMIGSGVFKYGKMIGTLTGEETRLVLFLRPKSLLQMVIASFPDPIHEDYNITVKLLKRAESTVKINTAVDPPKVKVTIPLTVQINSNPGMTDFTENMKNQQALKEAIEKNLENKSHQLIKKMQNEFKGDPFLWEISVRKNFWTIDEYNRYNWEEKFQHAQVDIKYEIFIESLGTQVKPSTISKRK